MSYNKIPLDELLLSDMTELPEELRKKLNGTAKPRDDEPTQVTKLFEELEECAAETKEELAKSSREARRVSRLTRNPKSYPALKLVLSSPPPPPEGEGDASSSG